MKRKIIEADKLLKKVMWEKLKYFSLKGAIKAYRELEMKRNV